MPGYEKYSAMRDRAKAVSWDQLLASGVVICGETDFVIEELTKVRDETGIDHILSWTRVGGFPEEKVKEHMTRMRDRIMPALRR